MQKSKSGLSIAAAPYRVLLKNGREQFHSRLSTLCAELKPGLVESVYDRHAKAFLDLATLFKSHRRKFIGYPAGVVETGNRQKRNMKTPNVNQRLKMLARKAKPPRKGGAYNLEMRAHDHKCHCGGINGEHETGTQGCFRFMTEAPAVRPDDHWFVDGDEITDYTLRHQRGYHQHDCGCWSRWPGSENSI